MSSFKLGFFLWREQKNAPFLVWSSHLVSRETINKQTTLCWIEVMLLFWQFQPVVLPPVFTFGFHWLGPSRMGWEHSFSGGCGAGSRPRRQLFYTSNTDCRWCLSECSGLVWLILLFLFCCSAALKRQETPEVICSLWTPPVWTLFTLRVTPINYQFTQLRTPMGSFKGLTCQISSEIEGFLAGDYLLSSSPFKLVYSLLHSSL